MSYGSSVNNVYLNRLDKKNAQSNLEETRGVLRVLRDDFMILASSAPRDIKEDGIMYYWEEYVRNQASELFEGIEEYAIKEYQCNILLEAEESEVTSG